MHSFAPFRLAATPSDCRAVMEVYIASADRNGKLEVLLTCKTSEKVIPQSVVRQSDLLKAIKFKNKKVACQFPWAAACNWAAWDPWEDPGWPAADLCGALQVLSSSLSSVAVSNLFK